MPPRKRADARIVVSIKGFGWDLARLVALHHSTLPWYEEFAPEVTLRGVPLSELEAAGGREALSLAGQFAAHLAFLRFAGFSSPEFDPSEWAVVRRRGSDSRLVRLRAGESNGWGEVPAASAIQAASEFLHAPVLQTIRQPWCKAEVVYHEIDGKLRGDARADLGWLHRSAAGCIWSPGVDAMRLLLRPGSTVIDHDCGTTDAAQRLLALSQDRPVLVFGDAGSTPLQQFSGVRSLGAIVGEARDESTIAERVADELPNAIAVIEAVDSLDERSRVTLRLLRRLALSWSWLVPEQVQEFLELGGEPGASTALFVVSPRVAAANELTSELGDLSGRGRFSRLSAFVEGEPFARFLDDGTLPPSSTAVAQGLSEPRRSYLSALGLLGETIPLELARSFLRELGCRLELEQLAVEGFCSISADAFRFVHERIARRLAANLTGGSRQTLSSIAARLFDARRDHVKAVELFIAAGDHPAAAVALQRIDWDSLRPADVLRVLGTAPRSLIASTPSLAERFATTLLQQGRYADALALLDALGPQQRALLQACVARRQGDYQAALQAIAGVADRFEVVLLRAELHRLQGSDQAAESALAAASRLAGSPGQKAQLEYEQAVLAIDRGKQIPQTPHLSANSYLFERLRCYSATAARDYAAAVNAAVAACRHASGLAEAIDASLDLLYAFFLAGEWEAARHQARRTLTLIEETQGDRGAGGVLFTLAYLAADSGHWAEAEHALARLRKFYRETADERRIDELRMLAAHLDFCRGRFREARQQLGSGVSRRWSPEIREAANLLLDEIEWVEGQLSVLRTSGESACLELTRRHLLNSARSGGRTTDRPDDAFSVRLFEWEQNAMRGELVSPLPLETRSQKVRFYRSVRAAWTRCRSEELRKLAHQTAAELGIEHREERPGSELSRRETKLLQQLAVASFPISPADLADFNWRFVSRNRLGQWTQFGSLQPLDPGALEALEQSPAEDWIACSDSSFAFVEGLEHFEPRTREAVRSMFRIKSENFRLRRVAEQDQVVIADRPEPPHDGILGEAPALQELVAMLDRLARSDVAVCLLGESGTGKELFARSIHLRSPRKSQPFTAINCAALPEQLIESELFGHARGAFTGADRDRAGLLEISDGGTVFLDEIGEMPPAAQAKLLRFLQEGEYRRVGETRLRHADVRVIAATNRKLEEHVDAGRFREDLYYRVRGIELKIPPLRERGSDILTLARQFLSTERQRSRGGADGFSEDVEAIFLSYRWPGNVRELQNTIRAAHALASERRIIDVEHLPERLRSVLIVRRPKGTYYEELLRFRRSLIERSLLEAGGNQNRAAKALGMTRQALAYQIRELGILVRQPR